MKLSIMRHGIAETLPSSAIARDEDRKLTKEGRTKTRLVADGLKRLGLKFDLILTSPLARARETAEIVAEQFGLAKKSIKETSALVPGSPLTDILKALQPYKDLSHILLVGHQPQLGELASNLVCGHKDAPIRFKKAGVCQVELDGVPPATASVLNFLLTPSQLELIGRAKST